MTDFNRIRQIIPKLTENSVVSEVTDRSAKRPLVLPAIVLFAVCFMTFITESKIPLIVSVAILSLFCVLTLIKRDLISFSGFVLTLILSLICGIRIITALSAPLPENSGGSYKGIVVSSETKLSGKRRIIARIGDINAEIRFNEDTDMSEITPGVTFEASGKFKEPVPPGNPGEFDYPGYLKSKGIRYLFYVDSIKVISKPSGPEKLFYSFPELCFSVRKSLFERITYGRDAEDKAILAAVCLGDTSLADESVTRDFRLSGCSHLLAVSGTHFAGFLIVLPYLLGAVSKDRRKNIGFYTFFTFLTACITGWSESVTRAAFMSSCSFAGRDTVSAMSAAAIVMLVSDPFCASRTGFLLSFSACIAIKLLSGRIRRFLSFFKERKGIVMALSAQTAALLGTMPFSGITDSSYGPVQFIVQALGSLLARLSCMMFVPGVFLSLFLPENTAYSVSSPSFLFLDLLKKLVSTGSRYSFMLSGRPSGPFILISFWLFAFLLLMPRFALRKPVLWFASIMMAISIGLCTAEFVRPVKAQIIFADVGQGDCCLIIADGITCLIDSGTFEKGASSVSDLLDHYGIGVVDIAFMTHWDQDHAGGIAALDKAGRIKEIYTGFTGDDEDTEMFEKSLKIRGCDPSSFRSRISKTEAGDVFTLSDDVSLTVLYPENCMTGGNPGSLVMLLDCCGTKMLFTGDIDLENEAELVSKDLISDVDVLKVSHHGSKYASSSEFLERAKPEISVISAGRNNMYGHPNKLTLGRLAKTGTRIYRTDQQGAVIFEFG